MQSVTYYFTFRKNVIILLLHITYYFSVFLGRLNTKKTLNNTLIPAIEKDQHEVSHEPQAIFNTDNTTSCYIYN